MVADPGMGGFNPYAQPNPYGPPPAAPPAADPYGPPPGGYGTPGPAPGGYGAPQGGYGAPAQPPAQPSYGGAAPPGGGYGQAPAQPQYGGAPQGGYGAPQGGYGAPQGGYGAPGGGFSPPQDQYGMSGGAPLVPMSGGGGGRGPIGKIRNPIMSIVFALFSCGIYPMVASFLMANELNAFRGRQDLNAIMFFIPIMNIIEGLKLAGVVLETKQQAGVPNPQVANNVLLALFPVLFLPADLNEIWQAASGGQLPPKG